MNKQLSVALLCTAVLVFSGCGENVKQAPIASIISGAPLSELELQDNIVGHTFTAQIKTGSKAGRYTFEYMADGELKINMGQYKRQWSIVNAELCVETCATYYAGQGDKLFGVQDGEVLVVLSPK